eukprot:m.477402 g.477402  ORF g.477402 m.477402 type:complete len:292 (+) comp20834_c0_seq1:284-1159(+)
MATAVPKCTKLSQLDLSFVPGTLLTMSSNAASAFVGLAAASSPNVAATPVAIAATATTTTADLAHRTPQPHAAPASSVPPTVTVASAGRASAASCCVSRRPGTTWSQALLLPRFQQFEEPLTGTILDKHFYNKEYGIAAKELMCDDVCSVEVFFEESPLQPGVWRLVDDDARQDLYEECQRHGCVPCLAVAHSGDDEPHADANHGHHDEEDEDEAAGTFVMFVDVGVEPTGTTHDVRDEYALNLGDTTVLPVRLGQIDYDLHQDDLSNRQRKKLERERRGVVAAMRAAEEA